jgi:hypothetical protein
MSDDEIFRRWPALEPSAGFADRVLARLPAPAPAAAAPSLAIVREGPPRASLRPTLVFAAVAAAVMIVFPLALRNRPPAAHAATAIAAGSNPDLGFERD